MQDFIIVFAEVGRGGSNLAVEARDLTGLRHQIEFAEARMEFTIPASAFTPPPRVDSALVLLDVREKPAVNVDDLGAFFRFVEAVFQGRRKQLGGTLGRISGIGSTAAGERVRKLGIDPERRPQTLSLHEWEAIYREFQSVES